MNSKILKTKALFILNPALLLTFSRPILILQTALYIETKELFLALVTAILAALTDAADGYVARKLNCKTKLGAFLDPIFDKVMLLLLFYFSPIFAAIILLLEIISMIISGMLRKYLNKHYTSPISKNITVGQMGLIGLLILLSGLSALNSWILVMIGLCFVLLSYTRLSIYIQSWQEKEYI